MKPLSGPILTAEQMRAAEQGALTDGVTLYDLMERAGAAVAEAVWRFGGGRATLILCGPGNNGGDGYVAARLLKARGLDVRVAALREPRAPEAIEARSRWDGPVEALEDAKPAPVLVDALFGTGLARALEDEVRTPLHELADAARFVLAVDVPSGVDTDTGADLGAPSAHLTLALGSLKHAHFLYPAAHICGDVMVADIGVRPSPHAHCRVLEKPPISRPWFTDHKYTRGYVAIVGGEMAGAAMLAAQAALRLAGYVAVVGARRPGPSALVHKRWDDIESDRRVDAILVGPGLGRGEASRAALAKAFACGKPLVIDGDALALTTVVELAARPGMQILTPHEGEFAKLFGDLEGNRIDQVRAAAVMSRSVVVLKGAATIVAEPDGQVWLSTRASGWLATAGTGDVLAGIAAARLAVQKNCAVAAGEAIWLHSEAARLAGPALTADDLPKYIPAAVAACL